MSFPEPLPEHNAADSNSSNPSGKPTTQPQTNSPHIEPTAIHGTTSPYTGPTFGVASTTTNIPPQIPVTIQEPYKRSRIWPVIILTLVVAVVSFSIPAMSIQVPYYTLEPGPAEAAGPHVDVEGGQEPDEDLVFLTVAIGEATLFDVVIAKFRPDIDVEPMEYYQPTGFTDEELERQGQEMMEESQRNATYVALTELGYTVTLEGTGAKVVAVVEEAAAFGILEEGDVIVAVDGEPIEFATEAVTAIGTHDVGDEVVLAVEREYPKGVQEETYRIKLGPYVTIDEATGEVEYDYDRAMLGVLLESSGVEADFPVEVEFNTEGIGGPSAGLMWTLEIMNQLTEEDLTNGILVAGTGTIAPDGTVGPIGGMTQKTYGALESGAKWLLVPEDNYAEAVEASQGKDITIIRMSTVEDALVFLDSL